MTTRKIDATLDAMLEQLASVEHERWAHWQRYMHGQGTLCADGSLLLPKELVQRWETQMATDYVNLSDQEKDSDREQVRRYLDLIKASLSGT